MKYIVLITLLLGGCSAKRDSLSDRKKYSDICNDTNVRSLVEADREITCYPPVQVRIVP